MSLKRKLVEGTHVWRRGKTFVDYVQSLSCCRRLLSALRAHWTCNEALYINEFISGHYTFLNLYELFLCLRCCGYRFLLCSCFFVMFSFTSGFLPSYRLRILPNYIRFNLCRNCPFVARTCCSHDIALLSWFLLLYTQRIGLLRSFLLLLLRLVLIFLIPLLSLA